MRTRWSFRAHHSQRLGGFSNVSPIRGKGLDLSRNNESDRPPPMGICKLTSWRQEERLRPRGLKLGG